LKGLTDEGIWPFLPCSPAFFGGASPLSASRKGPRQRQCGVAAEKQAPLIQPGPWEAQPPEGPVFFPPPGPSDKVIVRP
jgi:hypothetical protein